ncbi:unnamed protein product [Paramecium octaurelia]|uniref:Phosphoglycerate mutase n=1 Tax=Paramecium octaurelia TaxID=43137 RepID=A0A8S1W470_PAROT|nr:unnamed protein product [Paramecium octaurelia]
MLPLIKFKLKYIDESKIFIFYLFNNQTKINDIIYFTYIQKTMLKIILAFSLIFQSLCAKSILILRHGARDPQVWTEFDELYLWTDPIKILTQKGVDQLIEVGTKQQRASLFDSQGNCVYENIEIQSSKTARCTSSTVCFII